MPKKNNKYRLEVEIEVVSGSEFQHRLAEQMIGAATAAIADAHLKRHQSNKFEVETLTTIIPPQNAKESRIQT